MKKSAKRLSRRLSHTKSHKKRQNWIMKNRYLIIGIFCLLMVVLGAVNYLQHGLVLAVTTGPSSGGTTTTSKTTRKSPTPTPKPKKDPRIQALGCKTNYFPYVYSYTNWWDGSKTWAQGKVKVSVCANEYKRQLTPTHAIYIAREDAYITDFPDKSFPGGIGSCEYFLSGANGKLIPEQGAQYFLDEVSPDVRSHLRSNGFYYVNGGQTYVSNYPDSLTYLPTSTCPGYIAGAGASRDVSSDTVSQVGKSTVVQAFVEFHMISPYGQDLGDTYTAGPRLTVK